MKTFAVGVIVMTIAVAAGAEESLDVLVQNEGEPDPRDMMHTYLQGLAEQAFAARAEERAALETPRQIHKYQKRMRQFFIDQLGGWPEKTPLNARIVETIERDDCRIEKVIYESRPRNYVTALLFFPLSAPPYPGVLVPCGHSNNGKASEVYQRACISLAHHGMAALIYDPIDQGERFQILDENGKPRVGGTLGHTLVGAGCIPLGLNTAGYRIWDGIRGIDYLVSRDDIDPDRIGCTGNSGGGTLTSYIMALDERVRCAAPSCYLTSFRRLIETIDPQDAEQDIYNQIAYGMDHADYVMMRAPKPTLICCATQDFFDIRGTHETFEEAKAFYAKLDAEDRVDICEADDKHGFSQPRREGMVHWMQRWLMGIDEPVAEPEFAVLTDEEALCTPNGQVMLMNGARSVYEFNQDLDEELAKKRQAIWQKGSDRKALRRVREIAGIRPLAELPEPAITMMGTVERDGYRIEKLTIEPEPGVILPALRFVPKQPPTDACLYVHGDSKAADAAPGGPIEQLVLAGTMVLAPDLRGIGETERGDSGESWRIHAGPDWKDYFLAYMLGKSYVGMRAEDVLVCARMLQKANGGAPIRLVAIGEAGPPALHAAALEQDLFASLRLERGLVSWANLIRTPLSRNQLINTIHGALHVYDLPDLLTTLPAETTTVIEPVDAALEPVAPTS